MVLIVALAFIGMPILEIAVFIEVGGRIGLGPTMAVVVATALAGAALLRQQGLATLHRARHSLAEGRLPLTEVFDGLCLICAGALLLTPGFVTDGIGLLLFVPGVRAALRDLLGRRLVAAQPRSPRPDGGPVIEGEFHHLGEEEPGGGAAPVDGSRPPRVKVVPSEDS
ncbi:MAG: FxsA family protein [Rhodospirillales bacterium]|jgi:UPF0716 protein FxsA|nr:FxsA family protein [Rhodospirillales bacterium]